MIRVLHPDQVWDDSRSCFFVGLTPTKDKHATGCPVYQTSSGEKIVVVPRAE